MLKTGARIAVVAASGIYDPARLEAGLAVARARGLDPQVFPGMLAPYRYLAADDTTRTAHLVAALTEPGWDAVWIARGSGCKVAIQPVQNRISNGCSTTNRRASIWNVSRKSIERCRPQSAGSSRQFSFGGTRLRAKHQPHRVVAQNRLVL